MRRDEADELKGQIAWALLIKEFGSYSEVRKPLKTLKHISTFVNFAFIL